MSYNSRWEGFYCLHFRSVQFVTCLDLFMVCTETEAEPFLTFVHPHWDGVGSLFTSSPAEPLLLHGTCT